MNIIKTIKVLPKLLLPYKKLKKPIFLVGCGKSGTTMLGLIFSFHPDIGPKNSHAQKYNNLQSFLDSLVDLKVHGTVAHEMEEKPLWDKYLPIKGVDFRIGKELTLLSNPLSRFQTKMLINEITGNFNEKRFFSKQPFNTFRIHVLREIFPDAKILAIHRDGRDVVSSWGRESNRWEQLGGYEKGIPVFAQKWNEAVSHIEEHKESLNLYTFKYEDLISNPTHEIKKMFNYCELDYCPEIFDNLLLSDRSGKWKSRIPNELHPLLLEFTEQELNRLGYDLN